MARKTGRVRPGTAPTQGETDHPVITSPTGPLNYADIAILEVDDAWVSPAMTFAKEVAVAFAAGRPTRSWLVQFGGLGISPVGTDHPSGSGQGIGGGLGLPAAVVAQQLAASVTGYRVLTSDPPRIRGWLQGLFAHSDARVPPFQVDDLYDHFQDLRSLPAEQRDAIQAAGRIVRGGERAASEAARNAVYLAALSIGVQARLNEMKAHGEPDPGVAGP